MIRLKKHISGEICLVVNFRGDIDKRSCKSCLNLDENEIRK